MQSEEQMRIVQEKRSRLYGLKAEARSAAGTPEIRSQFSTGAYLGSSFREGGYSIITVIKALFYGLGKVIKVVPGSARQRPLHIFVKGQRPIS